MKEANTMVTVFMARSADLIRNHFPCTTEPTVIPECSHTLALCELKQIKLFKISSGQ